MEPLSGKHLDEVIRYLVFLKSTDYQAITGQGLCTLAIISGGARRVYEYRKREMRQQNGLATSSQTPQQQDQPYKDNIIF